MFIGVCNVNTRARVLSFFLGRSQGQAIYGTLRGVRGLGTKAQNSETRQPTGSSTPHRHVVPFVFLKALAVPRNSSFEGPLEVE